MRLYNTLIVTLIGLNTFIAATPQHRTGDNLRHNASLNSPVPDSIVLAKRYDSLLTAYYDNLNATSLEAFHNSFVTLDDSVELTTDTPDSVFIKRLMMINSAIPLPFNDVVKRHIVAYTTSRRSTMARVMGRSLYYFPIFESELDAAGLPIELRMLPVIESALSPTVKSRAGAVGLWQFIYTTAHNYGLEVSSFVDQRCDPTLSTRAACKYLKALYNIYNDWALALAAYNCGPGNVNRAMRRAGVTDANFWDLYPFLPNETRNYVPSFIAATYAYHYHKLYNIVPEPSPVPLMTDTVKINRIMHLEQISSTINTPIEILRALNPQYKIDIIPATGREYSLVMPQKEVSRFMDYEEEIMAKDTLYMAEYLKPSGSGSTKKEFKVDSFTYVVKSGDTLSTIASRNGVTVKELMKWNNLKTSKLRIGQKLEIYR